MLNQFQAYLVQRGYKEFSASGNPSSALDYRWRLKQVCLREGMTAEQLADNITTVLKQYDKTGDKWMIGKRSHESYINALKQFRKFVLVQRFGGVNA